MEKVVKGVLVHLSSHYKWYVASLIFVVFTGFVGENCVLNRIRQYREICELQEKIDHYNKIYNDEKEQLFMFRNDPEAMVKVARERYFMKNDDEDIYVVDDKQENDE